MQGAFELEREHAKFSRQSSRIRSRAPLFAIDISLSGGVCGMPHASPASSSHLSSHAWHLLFMQAMMHHRHHACMRCKRHDAGLLSDSPSFPRVRWQGHTTRVVFFSATTTLRCNTCSNSNQAEQRTEDRQGAQQHMHDAKQ